MLNLTKAADQLALASGRLEAIIDNEIDLAMDGNAYFSGDDTKALVIASKACMALAKIVLALEDYDASRPQ